jgi:phosphoglycolate phosphatase-like HAD superfamily hydrolase
MPQKSVTSINENKFSMNRVLYTKTIESVTSETADIKKESNGWEELPDMVQNMILELSAKHQIDLGSSVVVGDRWRDIDAGNSAGCQTLFVNYGYNEILRSRPTWEVSAVSQAGLVLRKYFGLDEYGD